LKETLVRTLRITTFLELLSPADEPRFQPG
jgi:hypothetical protein